MIRTASSPIVLSAAQQQLRPGQPTVLYALRADGTVLRRYQLADGRLTFWEVHRIQQTEGDFREMCARRRAVVA